VKSDVRNVFHGVACCWLLVACCLLLVNGWLGFAVCWQEFVKWSLVGH